MLMRIIALAVITCGVVLGFSGAGSAQMSSTPRNVKITSGMLSDAKGMTLYTYDKDTVAGKSACSGQCQQNWPALPVVSGGMAMGNWTVISRDDGSKQWAYKGKPLYTFAHDAKAGDMTGDGKGGGAWHMAMP
jgi:predicted lipoprotein with Yx(FWY)xxD motif